MSLSDLFEDLKPWGSNSKPRPKIVMIQPPASHVKSSKDRFVIFAAFLTRPADDARKLRKAAKRAKKACERKQLYIPIADFSGMFAGLGGGHDMAGNHIAVVRFFYQRFHFCKFYEMCFFKSRYQNVLHQDISSI